MLHTSTYPPGTDEYFMHEALNLARCGLGRTAPNPLVGCVLVRNGKIIGRGYHARYGEEHAEVRAIADAGDAQDATAYVTLEPCSHTGHQPPCCQALAAAGVKRALWGCDDANPVTAGRARRMLAGLGVETGPLVLADRCAEFLDYYNAAIRAERPFFHLKLALSADGKMACPSGHSQWLSGPEALGYAHYLRLKYDAVLVSYRTVLHDNPHLTVRAPALHAYYQPPLPAGLRQPVRVVLDPTFAIAGQLEQLNAGRIDTGDFRVDLPRLVIAGDIRHLPKQPPLPGLQLIGLESGNGPLSFSELAGRLWSSGIRSVLVEGGARLAAEIINQELVDKITLIYTPTIIGGDGLGFTSPRGHDRIQQCPRLAPHQVGVIGNDAVLEGYPDWHPASESGSAEM